MVNIASWFGGGSSGTDRPKLKKDGLDSTQYATIVDLISEGEIEGLKAGHRSVYFENTALAIPARSCSYSRSGTTITVSLVNHGFIVGQTVYLEFLNGTAVSGLYVIVTKSNDVFTVTSSATGTTSGSVFCSASYSRTTTTITVTHNSHGFKKDDGVYLQFVSGAAVTGSYIVTSATTNTFTVTSTDSGSTTGNVLVSSYSFQKVDIYSVNGTQNQNYLPMTDGIEDEKPVGVTVTNDIPVTRTIVDPNVDKVRITISIPALQKSESDGDVVGSQIDFSINLQYAGGGFTQVLADTIKGRSGDLYQKDYLITLNGSKPVDIKIIRITPDAANSRTQNSFSWSSYTEIITTKLRYPYSALVGLRIDAEQFSNIPSRTYLVRGIKIKIPLNATVNNINGALNYSGIWNGNFGSTQWCSDPAWILYDLLISNRYGFGDHIKEAQLDKWSFYAASQYCSALNTYNTAAEIANRAAIGLAPRTGTTDDYNSITGRHGVPDGFGNYEPRFSCNVNIQTAEEAYKLINDLASVFRAMPYWSVGALTFAQDKPVDSSYLFTLANVTSEGFSYQSSSSKTRPTVVVASYLDLETRETAQEVVEDTAAIIKYGSVVSEITAFACTSRGQANRIGKWLLYSEQYESEVISFKTSVDAGVIVRPGQVIDVADPMKSGQRKGGRVVTATANQVQIDDVTGISAGNNRTLSVILPDGTLETRSVSVVSGTLITVSSPFSQVPNSNTVWIYQTDDIKTTQWRVLAVQEQDRSSYVINAISYNASKYSYVENNRPLEYRDTTNLNDLPASPKAVSLSETLYYYQDQIRAKVIAYWDSVTGVNQYQVHWRKNSGNWNVINKVGIDYEILDITPGTFEFKVYSLSAGLRLSANYATNTIIALGKTAPPSDVTSFVATVDSLIGVSLSWAAVLDIDLSVYEIRTGASWATSTLLAQTNSTTYKVGYLNSSNQTFWIKALDTSSVYSANAASVSVTINKPNAVTITSQIQDPLAVLSWTQPAITSYAISYYIVSYGATYGSAIEISRTNSTTFSTPATWSGSRTFWVTPVDVVGGLALSPNSTSVTINQAAAPTISGSASGSTATLNWTAVSGTLTTQSYQIRRGSTFSTATIIASITGTSYTLKADWSGSQTFWVVAVDGNGILGTQGSVAISVAVAPAPTVSAQFAGRDVVISWTAAKGTLDTDYYVVRRGNTFATATTIATAYATTYTLRVNWGGSERFWIVAVDVNGSFGTEANVDVLVQLPTAPSITQQVIDNNVLLKWSGSTSSLPIEYFELRKGSTWATATVIGTKQGGFTTTFESQSGSYRYWLAGIDSAGNYGTPAYVDAVVNQPPDYILQLDQDSTWAGEEVNVYTDSFLGQIVNVNLTETWQSHFTSRGYTSPQDQITAGYTYYLMPTTTTASYEEEFDAGALLAGTKILSTLSSTTISGVTTATPTLRVRGITSTAATYSQAGTTTITITSNAHGLVANDYVWLDFTTGTAVDGTYIVATAATNTFTVTAASAATTSGNVSWVKWITYAGSNEVYATGFRYFRVRYDFSSAGGDDLLVLTRLNVHLDSKLRNDAGSGIANAADSGGTTVNFNIAFVDVQSISVTAASTSAVFAVYDFIDVPNPTSFKVLLYNTAGTRVSGSFSWSARGV